MDRVEEATRTFEPERELRTLAEADGAPCVTLYLNTWTKEITRREQAALFVRRRIERALAVVEEPALRRTLARVAEEASRRLEPGNERPRSIAVFAAPGSGLFRVLELDVEVENELVIAAGPAIRQLARLCAEWERTVLVLVSAENARVFEIVLGRPVERVAISGERIDKHHVEHPSPGSIQMHYQQHVREHIDRHLREVAEKTTALVDRLQPQRVLVGGVQPTVDRFLHELPSRVRTRVIDVVALPPDARLAEIAHRALESMRASELRRVPDVVRETLDLALAGGPAALGLEEVLDAAREGRLMSLVLLDAFRRGGVRCRDCRALARDGDRCEFCGGQVEAVELSEALVRAVVGAGGAVEFAPRDPALERVGGIAARLRW